jgi:hypothetical protein
LSKLRLARRHTICGSAAPLCGKAAPFRCRPFLITCFRPREGLASPRRKRKMFWRFRPERPSLSAQQGAKPPSTLANLDSPGINPPLHVFPQPRKPGATFKLGQHLSVPPSCPAPRRTSVVRTVCSSEPTPGVLRPKGGLSRSVREFASAPCGLMASAATGVESRRPRQTPWLPARLTIKSVTQ